VPLRRREERLEGVKGQSIPANERTHCRHGNDRLTVTAALLHVALAVSYQIIRGLGLVNT